MAEQVIPVYKETLEIENYIQLTTPELLSKERELEYWKYKPDVTERQKDEIKRILAHLSFEIAMRTSEFDPLG